MQTDTFFKLTIPLQMLDRPDLWADGRRTALPAGCVPLAECDGRVICFRPWPAGWIRWDRPHSQVLPLDPLETQREVLALHGRAHGIEPAALLDALPTASPDRSEVLASGAAMISTEEAVKLLRHAWLLKNGLLPKPCIFAGRTSFSLPEPSEGRQG